MISPNPSTDRDTVPFVRVESEGEPVDPHPGLLSGLAFAGANNPPETGGNDGILTALEVAALDFGQAEMVVLSACDTGLGPSAGREGLLGLQRAFQIAGAKSCVASLWSVDDAATQALMIEFYRNLWERKLSRIDALRQAQLTMLESFDPGEGLVRGTIGKLPGKTANNPPSETRNRQSARVPPRYWAAFVLSGDWR